MRNKSKGNATNFVYSLPSLNVEICLSVPISKNQCFTIKFEFNV